MKHIFVFDDDIDIMSPEEVEWAIATRVQRTRMFSLFQTLSA